MAEPFRRDLRMHSAGQHLGCMGMPQVMEPNPRDLLYAPDEAGEFVSQAQSVRLQMVWDNLSCLGTEALAHWS
jgi:hypothetical protein